MTRATPRPYVFRHCDREPKAKQSRSRGAASGLRRRYAPRNDGRRIASRYERKLFLAGAHLDLFLAGDGALHRLVEFEPHRQFARAARRESGNQYFPMPPRLPRQARRHPRINRAVARVRRDVDGGVPHAVWPLSRNILAATKQPRTVRLPPGLLRRDAPCNDRHAFVPGTSATPAPSRKDNSHVS